MLSENFRYSTKYVYILYTLLVLALIIISQYITSDDVFASDIKFYYLSLSVEGEEKLKLRFFQ